MRDNVQAMGILPVEHERTVSASTNPAGRLNDIHATVHDCHDIHVDVRRYQEQHG